MRIFYEFILSRLGQFTCRLVATAQTAVSISPSQDGLITQFRKNCKRPGFYFIFYDLEEISLVWCDFLEWN